MRTLLCVSFAATLSFIAGCGPGAAAEAVRPEAPSAAEALNEEAKPECNAVPGNSEPLIVDLTSQQRVDLEVAMKSGLPVVKYGCEGLTILKGCSLKGDFSFAGVSIKEDVVQLTSSDEVRASLPISGATLAGELSRGASLDLALAMIGKQTSLTGKAAAGDLTGSCDGATHFVRAATVGAFAMRRGSGARVKAAADIFGASAGAESQSDKVSTVKDGVVDDCRKFNPDAASPPAQCRSAIRVELVPLGADKAPSDGAVGAIQDPCPEGYALSGGKCAPKASAEAFLCPPDDEQVCRAQCDKGSAESCFNLASLLAGIADLCKDSKGDSCFAYTRGVPEKHPQHAQFAEAAKLYERACDAGVPAGCFMVGLYFEDGAFGKPKDEAQADKTLDRGCMQGHSFSCTYLADKYEKKNKKDPRAAKYLQRACDLGAKPACFRAISKHLKGEGTPKSPEAAVAILKRTCNAGEAKRCGELGLYNLDGTLGKKDVATGLEYLTRSCDMDAKNCRYVALAYSGEWGVPKDGAKAREYFARACAGDEAKTQGCKRLEKRLPKP